MAEEGQTETEPKKKSNKSKDKIIEALTESNESYKKQIELLEKRYKELENKVMAPVRNDEDFLLKLYNYKNKKRLEIGKSSDQDHNNSSHNAIWYNGCPGVYIGMDYTIYTTNSAALPIHKSFFNPGCDIDNYIKCLLLLPIPIDSKNYIGQTIIKHRTGCKFKQNLFNVCSIKNRIKVFLNTGFNPNNEMKLWMEIHIHIFENRGLFVYLIELDDLSDKVAIENLYKKENLLE